MPTYPRVLRALLLDGEATFVAQLRRFDAALNFDLDCRTAPVPLACLRRGRPDLLLIDPATTGPTGWDYLARLYEFIDLSLVVCSAPVSREQRVCGLRRGVDAWLTKPIHPLELMARIEAVARGRRCGLKSISKRLAVADVLIRPDRKVFVGGTQLPITPSEFAVLAELVAARGRVLRREELYRRVWGYAMDKGDRSVDVLVKRLRRKLRTASPARVYIHTHQGVGYRFDPEPSAVDAHLKQVGFTEDPAVAPRALLGSG